MATSSWWASKSPAQKKAYLAAHPNSKYAKGGAKKKSTSKRLMPAHVGHNRKIIDDIKKAAKKKSKARITAGANKAQKEAEKLFGPKKNKKTSRTNAGLNAAKAILKKHGLKDKAKSIDKLQKTISTSKKPKSRRATESFDSPKVKKALAKHIKERDAHDKKMRGAAPKSKKATKSKTPKLPGTTKAKSVTAANKKAKAPSSKTAASKRTTKSKAKYVKNPRTGRRQKVPPKS